jgi:hypothetical protein
MLHLELSPKNKFYCSSWVSVLGWWVSVLVWWVSVLGWWVNVLGWWVNTVLFKIWLQL